MDRPVLSLVFASGSDIESTAERVAAALGVEFERRESSFRGGDYFLAGHPIDGDGVIVQSNEDFDGERFWDVEAPTIVLVESTTRGAEIQASLTSEGLRLLSQDAWVISD